LYVKLNVLVTKNVPLLRVWNGQLQS